MHYWFLFASLDANWKWIFINFLLRCYLIWIVQLFNTSHLFDRRMTAFRVINCLIWLTCSIELRNRHFYGLLLCSWSLVLRISTGFFVRLFKIKFIILTGNLALQLRSDCLKQCFYHELLFDEISNIKFLSYSFDTDLSKSSVLIRSEESKGFAACFVCWIE